MNLIANDAPVAARCLMIVVMGTAATVMKTLLSTFARQHRRGALPMSNATMAPGRHLRILRAARKLCAKKKNLISCVCRAFLWLRASLALLRLDCLGKRGENRRALAFRQLGGGQQ